MASESKNVTHSIGDMNFDFLTSLILKTQKTKPELLKEWSKFENFLEEFPDYKAQYNKNLMLTEFFIIDNYRKVYKQMKKPEHVVNDQVFNLYYYEYNPGLCEKWESDLIPLGGIDSEGLINTGSDILLKCVGISFSVFLNQYFSLSN